MAPLICSNCGHLGKPVLRTRGSLAVEILLWLLIIVPGIIYTVWRMATKYDACAACGSTNLLGVETPRGRQLMQQFHPGADTRSDGEVFGEKAGRALNRLADRINRALGG